MRETFPTSNFGSSSFWNEVQGTIGTRRHSYIKFNVNVAGTITNAKLFLRTTGNLCNANPPEKCLQIYNVPDNTWTELGVTWNTRPAFGSLLAEQEDMVSGVFILPGFDVTSVIINGQLNTVGLAQTDGVSVLLNIYTRVDNPPPKLQITYT